MNATAVTSAPEIDVLRSTAQLTDFVLRANVEGISHDDSLIQPPSGANCMNWVVGHLACIYNNALPLLGQQPVRDKVSLQRYDRGSKPIVDDGEALNFRELMSLWDEAQKRVEAGLSSLPVSRLDEPAPFSPTNNPNETVRSLLTILLFHQAYHAGQTGVLRRLMGKAGAIK
jgi:uncharacterized damage-inducible protein DinB